MSLLRISVLILLTFCVFAQAEMPHNVIFMIGDGMGYAQIEATNDFFGGSLSFESFPNQAQGITNNIYGELTDSAAAGTALATGFKVANSVISMQYPGDGSELLTLLEYAKDKGKSVGLVSTAYLTHATPACFGAHVSDRNNTTDIASDYLSQTLPNVLFGGGGNGLTVTDTANAGYVVVTNMNDFNLLDTTKSYVSAQFGFDHMPYKYDYVGTDPYAYPYPLLSEMVIKAIDILDNNENGYFLMVEGGRIDHACHDNNLERCVWETRDFSFAVQAAVNLAGSNTLILVTADHETGGLHFNETSGVWEFSTTGHTAVNVPVYAIGPNADLVNGTMDNTDMFNVCSGGITEPPIEEICYAIDESTVRSTVQNDYKNTYANDGVYETIQEVLNNPNKNGYSLLEHIWAFDVGSAASAVFYVNAFHSSNDEADDFIFSYSTDGTNYTDMLTVYATSDEEMLQYYELPSNINGTVYIRVTDTDHTKGNKSLDSLSVDQMYIQTNGEIPQPDTPQYMFDSVVLNTVRADKGAVYGLAIVTIVDEYGNPVNGALVKGKFTGAFLDDFTEDITHYTVGNGTVVFETSTSDKKPSFGFEVTSVSGPLEWVQ